MRLLTLILLTSSLVSNAIGFALPGGHQDPDTKMLHFALEVWKRIDAVKTETLNKEQRLFLKTAAIVGALSKETRRMPIWPKTTIRDVDESTKELKQAIGKGFALVYLNVKDVASTESLKTRAQQALEIWEQLKNAFEGSMKIAQRDRQKDLNWLIRNYMKFYKFKVEILNQKIAAGTDPNVLVGELLQIQKEVNNLMDAYSDFLQKQANKPSKGSYFLTNHNAGPGRGFGQIKSSKDSAGAHADKSDDAKVHPLGEVEKIQLKPILPASIETLQSTDVPLEKDNMLALLLKFKILSAYQIFPTVPFCAAANVLFLASNLCGKLFAGVTERQADILRELSKRIV